MIFQLSSLWCFPAQIPVRPDCINLLYLWPTVVLIYHHPQPQQQQQHHHHHLVWTSATAVELWSPGCLIIQIIKPWHSLTMTFKKICQHKNNILHWELVSFINKNFWHNLINVYFFFSKYWDWDRMIEWYKPSWWSIYRPGVTRPVVSVFLVIHCLPLPPNTNTILLTTLYTLALTTPAIFLVLIFIYFPGPSFTVWGLSVSGERSRGKLRYFSHFLIRSFISFSFPGEEVEI